MTLTSLLRPTSQVHKFCPSKYTRKDSFSNEMQYRKRRETLSIYKQNNRSTQCNITNSNSRAQHPLIPHTLKQQPIVISAAYLPTTRAITHKDSLQLCIQNEGRLWHAAGEPSTTTHLDVFYLQTHLVNLCLGMMNCKTKLSEKKVQSSTPTPHPTGSLSVSAIWSLLVLGKINSQSLKIEDRYIDESAAFFLPPCKIDLKKS